MWKDVVGYEGIYEVSDEGAVRTKHGKTTFTKRSGIRTWVQRVLKQKVSKDRTCRVSLWKEGKERTMLVHRLVAYAFIPEIPGKFYINHKDGNRLKNLVSNLEWCTHYENNNHAFDTNLIKTAIKISLRNIETGEVLDFRSMSKAGEFLGRNAGYISGLLKKSVSQTGGFEIIRQDRVSFSKEAIRK